ncbi:MAG: response regulator [Xanthomonadaceae bacterium]|nr:response regulator [Xanthomonadaceae bacterium]MDE2245072.1 response regulator [Xanthomonadaceae bacterium]
MHTDVVEQFFDEGLVALLPSASVAPAIAGSCARTFAFVSADAALGARLDAALRSHGITLVQRADDPVAPGHGCRGLDGALLDCRSESELTPLASRWRDACRTQSVPLFALTPQADRERRVDMLAFGMAFIDDHGGDVAAIAADLATGSDLLADEPIRVMIVDDDFGTSFCVKKILESAGIDCHAFIDADMAIAQLDKLRPDVVVLDFMMPGCDGVDVCDRIRARPDGGGTQILFFSGNVDASSRGGLLSVLGDDYLGKGARPRDLVAAVFARGVRARTWRRSVRVAAGLAPA